MVLHGLVLPLLWPCNHVELMFDGLCRDTMEAQQRTLGGHVKIAIHSIYRRGLGLGLVWTSRFPDRRSAVRDQGGGTSQLHSYKSIAPLKNIPFAAWNPVKLPVNPWTNESRPKGKWTHRETWTVRNPVANLNINGGESVVATGWGGGGCCSQAANGVMAKG